MPYPDHCSPSAYVARWDNPQREDDDAEGRYLADAFFTHGIPLLVALQSAEFSDTTLNDMCQALAVALENGVAGIKKRGDL